MHAYRQKPLKASSTCCAAHRSTAHYRFRVIHAVMPLHASTIQQRVAQPLCHACRVHGGVPKVEGTGVRHGQPLQLNPPAFFNACCLPKACCKAKTSEQQQNQPACRRNLDAFPTLQVTSKPIIMQWPQKLPTSSMPACGSATSDQMRCPRFLQQGSCLLRQNCRQPSRAACKA